MSVAHVFQLPACLVPLRTFTSTAEYPFVTFLTDLAILLMLTVYVEAWVLRRRGIGAAREEEEYSALCRRFTIKRTDGSNIFQRR
jgi:hypothetical protein